MPQQPTEQPDAEEEKEETEQSDKKQDKHDNKEGPKLAVRASARLHIHSGSSHVRSLHVRSFVTSQTSSNRNVHIANSHRKQKATC